MTHQTARSIYQSRDFLLFSLLQNHGRVYKSLPTEQSLRQWNRVESNPTLKSYFSNNHFNIILYYNQQMHNYFTNYRSPTCFDTTVSSSDSLQSIPCQDTQVFQMQLLVIQFTIMMFHEFSCYSRLNVEILV
jgi:hypothetical protein